MLKIGLLGGSFNPPHAGHLHLARFAHQKLKLDQVWLLPVPQNTLKDTQGIAPFTSRIAMCEALASEYSWLHATDDEAKIATNETLDTVRYMQQNYPHKFVWIMGADSFATVHDWGYSNGFYQHIPTAVFARTEAENTAAHTSPTAQKSSPQLPESFAQNPQNGWSFFPMPAHPARATDIRHILKNNKQKQELKSVSSAVNRIIVAENLYQNP